MAVFFSDDDLASRDSSGVLKPLAQGQFDLGGYTVGGADDPVLLTQFDPGEAYWGHGDVVNPFGSEVWFGRDQLHPPVFTFHGATNAQSVGGALAASRGLQRVWWDEPLKAVPGSYQILRYNLDGVVRRVYGRARKCVVEHTPSSYVGTSNVLMTFNLLSNHFFDDEQRSVSLSLIPNTTGGLVAPLTAPLTAVQMGEGKGGSISDVGGDAPAPFHVFFQGPVERPWVEMRGVVDPWSGRLVKPGWRIALSGSVGEGEVVRVSTFPGRLGAVRRGGGAVSLTADSSLGRARLYPGSTSLMFGGVDPSGLSRATVVWRPAWAGL